MNLDRGICTLKLGNYQALEESHPDELKRRKTRTPDIMGHNVPSCTNNFKI